MRAVTILKGYDSSKHSGIIAYFNQNFIKTGEYDKSCSKIVKGVSLLRKIRIMKIFILRQNKILLHNWIMRNDLLLQLKNI